MSPNAIRWDKIEREIRKEKKEDRLKIIKKFDRLSDLEDEIKNYYYKDKYLLMASRLIEFKKHLLAIFELLEKKENLMYEFTEKLDFYTRKYQVYKNLK